MPRSAFLRLSIILRDPSFTLWSSSMRWGPAQLDGDTPGAGRQRHRPRLPVDTAGRGARDVFVNEGSWKSTWPDGDWPLSVSDTD